MRHRTVRLLLVVLPLLVGCSPSSIGTDETREVPAGAVEGIAADGFPRVAVAWVGPDRIAVTTWGSSSCATRPVHIERTGAREFEVRVRATDGRDVCTADDSPTTNEVTLPDGLHGAAPLDVLVDDGGDTTTRLTLPPPGPQG